MDVRQLRYFLAIVEAGSLSKAAGQVGVAQPALSQHVRHLETELGVTLLDRNARGVTPTDAGERLCREARTILNLLAELPQQVMGAVTDPIGEVRIGMSGTVSELVGVPLIEAARDRYPGIRIRLVEAMSGHVLDWLRRGEVDVALVYATSDPKGLEVAHLLTEDLCLFGRPGGQLDAPKGTVVDMRDVVGLQLITPGPTHGLRRVLDDAAAVVGVSLQPAFEVDSYGNIKRLARSGIGHAILTPTAIAREVGEGVFESWRIGPKLLRRNIYLAHSSERPFSAASRVAADLAREVIRRLVSEGVWLADLADEQAVRS
ncbi:LysR family transcriptional regulator [Phenylobacterium sp.]|uniref:LysR family transcriptional regulator n=1 Tax=Phenylobacterium sp. TaxID=1871053 RepID=UPI002FC5B7B9